MFKLPKKVKAVWLKALRSGKYKQADGYLSERADKGEGGIGGYKHCCLGVARACGLGKQATDLYGSKEEYLTSDFMPQEEQQKLAKMNDDGQSFNTIADFIAKNY